MGCCSSSQPNGGSGAVQESSVAPRSAPAKFLLLGTGTSGKTTVFKQLKLFCGNFSREDRLMMVPQILEEVVSAMQILIRIAVEPPLSFTFEGEAAQAMQEVLAMELSLKMERNPLLAKNLATLWGTNAIRVAHQNRHLVQALVDSGEIRRELCVDNYAVFMRDIDSICEIGYVPTNEHIVSVRSKTTGVTEAPLTLMGSNIVLVDVGGQRNERRKWVNVFDGVRVVLYVISLSDYDQMLSEDAGVNRMVESLEIWSKMTGHVVFERSLFFVLLNKVDVLDQKISGSSPTYPSEVFPDYVPCNATETATFIKNKFLKAMTHGVEGQNVFCFFTNATLQEDVQRVLAAAIDKSKETS